MIVNWFFLKSNVFEVQNLGCYLHFCYKLAIRNNFFVSKFRLSIVLYSSLFSSKCEVQMPFNLKLCVEGGFCSELLSAYRKILIDIISIKFLTVPHLLPATFIWRDFSSNFSLEIRLDSYFYALKFWLSLITAQKFLLVIMVFCLEILYFNDFSAKFLIHFQGELSIICSLQTLTVNLILP